MQKSLFSSPPKPTRTIRLMDTMPLPLIQMPTLRSRNENDNIPRMEHSFCKLIPPSSSQEDSEFKDIMDVSGHPKYSDGLIPIETRTEVTSMEMESEYVDAAIANVRSLPQVVSEVALMQRGQADEIQKQNTILDGFKANLAQERDGLENIKKDLASERRRGLLSQSDITILEDNCQQLHADIGTLSTQVEAKRGRLSAVEEQLAKDNKVYEEYGTKMETYRVKVAALESSNSIYKQVEEQQDHVTLLLEERNAVESNQTDAQKIINGCYEEQITTDIEDTEAEHKRLDLLIKDKAEQLKTAAIETEQAAKDTEVLHKRNAAQLTRLKRQLREIQARHRHWNEQATQLELAITETKTKLLES